MIDRTLAFLTDALNAYLRTRFPSSAELSVLGTVAREPGVSGEDIRNRLVVTLVNIEREPTAGNARPSLRMGADSARRVPQPLNLNLILLLSANFPENYADSLKVLSAAIAFFQSHPLHTRQSSPGLPEGLDRLSVEWRDLDLEAIHNLWSVLGGNYMPSAVFKARMLVVDQDFIGTDVSIITSTDTSG